MTIVNGIMAEYICVSVFTVRVCVCNALGCKLRIEFKGCRLVNTQGDHRMKIYYFAGTCTVKMILYKERKTNLFPR